jgi:hypothetical protein
MTRRAIAASSLIVILAAAVPVSAQRGRRAGGGNAAAGLPLATTAILRNPEVYYGKQITVSAGVEHMLTKTAFVVDQWRMTGPNEVAPIGKPILVVAPYLTSSLPEHTYMLMRGELIRLDTAAVARVAAEFKIDLGPDLWSKYQGQPLLLAASVINGTYTELAKKPVAPPTSNDLALSEAMKTISAASTALKAAVDNAQADGVAVNVAKLKPAFGQTESIWDDVGQSSAGQLARDAQEYIVSIEHDAAAGNWDRAKFAAGKLNQVCGSCHGTFRDRADDGTFRMKAGTF